MSRTAPKMHSSSPLPAFAQSSRALAGSWREFPDASRPYDWKHSSTKPSSLRRHQSAVFFQSQPTRGRICEVTSR